MAAALRVSLTAVKVKALEKAIYYQQEMQKTPCPLLFTLPQGKQEATLSSYSSTEEAEPPLDTQTLILKPHIL